MFDRQKTDFIFKVGGIYFYVYLPIIVYNNIRLKYVKETQKLIAIWVGIYIVYVYLRIIRTTDNSK